MQKKTPRPVTLTLPANAGEAYEALRAQALWGGGERTGLAAVVHHGMVIGLTKMAAPLTAPATPSPDHPESGGRSAPSIATDPALVRLLANMVLRVHAEARHVY